MTQHKLTSALKNPAIGWGRRLVLAQITVQIGVALTPFYASSVYAMLSDDSATISSTARHTSTLGQAIQSGNLHGLATQQAGSLATQEIQQWLQSYGTARVELGTNEHFAVKTGAVDLLIPLSKSEQRLLFTQGGVRNKDGQITGNLGLGQRHFVSDWMLGYNAFYDHNVSRGHQRLGVGTEAWRDNLKLSGNAYYRLSSWKTSRDVEDYDERPANGFDLRAEAYLPAYPALGGKLMYEKYFGNEVGLFGSDKRQSNPNAVTAGVSYTPVPLVSVSADHRRGGSQSDTLFGLQMTYQLGESFLKQINPGAIADRRSLAGSAMDLVERNNNIVLEYRKKQLVNFALPKEMTGASMKTLDLTYTLTSKYPLAKIIWNDAALVAAGGKISDLGGGKYQLALPAYQAGVSNTYPLSGVAVDVRNNASPVASTLVMVTVPAVSVANSGVTASPAILPADGKSTSTITITLIDEEGNALPGMAAELTGTLSEALNQTVQAKNLPLTPAQLSEAQETAANSGIYTFVLTAGTRAGVATVTPAMAGIALKAVTVSETADTSSATLADGSLKITTDNSVANGSTANRIDARVIDAGGNPLANVPITFSLSGSAQVSKGGVLTVISDADGNVSLQFTDTVAETVTVKASTSNGSSATADTVFKADASTASLQASDLTVDRTSVLANGSDNITFTALVKDAHGNPVPEMSLTWTASAGSLGATDGKTDAAGKISVTLSNTVVGNVQVAASVGGSTPVNAPEVNFTADDGSAGIGSGDLTSDKTTAVANGTEVVTYSALVKDAQGNAVPNMTVSWVSDLGNLSGASSTTGADGSATITLSSVQAGSAVVTATVNGANTAATAVSFTADGGSAQIGSGDLTSDKPTAVANGTEVVTYTALVKDANGNAVPNMTVNWVSDLGNLSGVSSTTGADGRATITLSSIQAGSAVVTATVNGANTAATAVSFTADGSSAQIGSGDLKSDKPTAVANGTEVVTYTALVKDAHGNAVPNMTVNWVSDLGNLSGTSSTTGADGRATITLSSVQAGSAVVTATVNGANTAATAVSFTADASSARIDSGDLNVDKLVVIANGSDRATYQAQVKDAQGNPVIGISVSWATDFASLSGASSITDQNGIAIVTLSGMTAGQATVTASVNGSTATATPVQLKADSGSAAIGDLAADKTTAVANGSEVVTYTALVKDANGNPVPEVYVNWASDLGDLVAPATITDADGKATVTLTSTAVGMAKAMASVNGGAAVNAAQVTFIADGSSAQIGSGDLRSDKPTAVANGTEVVTYTALVKDAHGNAVPNMTVSWVSDLGNLSGASSTTGTDGSATITLSSVQAGSAVVTATVNGADTAATAVSFTADGSSAQIGSGDLTSDKTTAVANGTEIVTYTALVKDANGNAVPNMTVSWASDLGNLSGASSTTGTDGRATITLSSIQAGSAVVTATVNGANTAATAVSFTADGGSAQIGSGDLTSDKTTAVANGTEIVTYTALVKDANGNAVPNMTVSWVSDLGNLSGASSTTGADGRATITLSSIQAGSAVVTATVNGANTAATAVSFTADGGSAQIGSGDLKSDKTTAVANGTEIVTYTALVKDANGNVVPNMTVNWVSDLGNLSGASSTTGADGSATITLSSVQAGSAVVTATVNVANTAATAVSFTADGGSAQIGSGDLRSDKTTAVANGTEIVTYTALVKDANGNVVPNMTVSWVSDLGNLSGTSSTTGADGRATITLSSIQAGSAVVTATVNVANTAATAVSFTADGSSAQIGSGDLKVDKVTVVANNVDKAVYSAIVTDANGNPVSGHTVSWITDNGTLSAASSVTDASGLATIELRDTKVEAATVQATVNGAATPAEAVTFIADVATAKVDTIVSDKTLIIGTGQDMVTLTATVTDAFGNPVSNVPVTWSAILGDISDSSDTQPDGKATATLTALYVDTVTGNAGVTAKTNNLFKTHSVTVRPVMQLGSKYLWTLTEYPTKDEATAQGYCSKYGDGAPATRADFGDFVTYKQDFATMKVNGQYVDARYYIGGEWRNNLYADYNSNTAPIGIRSDTQAPTNNGYVCVK